MYSVKLLCSSIINNNNSVRQLRRKTQTTLTHKHSEGLLESSLYRYTYDVIRDWVNTGNTQTLNEDSVHIFNHFGRILLQNFDFQKNARSFNFNLNWKNLRILLKANVKTTEFDEVLLKATVNALLTHTQVGTINTKWRKQKFF